MVKWFCIQLMHLALWILLALPRATLAVDQTPVSICVDSDPPSPDLVQRDTSGKQIFQVTGISAEIVRAAMNHLGKKVNFNAELPWNRCLKAVELGEIDFALGVYYTEERARVFRFSNHYNTLTPQVFYSASKTLTPNGPDDLKKYHGCGVYGYSYDHYKIRQEDLEMSLDYDSLFRKLLAGNCDYLIEEVEAIYDSNHGKAFLADPRVKRQPARWAEPPARYLVTAKVGRNLELMDKVNAALEFVIRSGQAEAIWKKSMGELPYRP